MQKLKFTTYRKFHKIPLSRLFTSRWQEPNDGCKTGIQIYNCIARKNVPLILHNKDYATWYTCGPTVYDSTHIGHASCYVKLDILQRILRNYFNINLVTAMNITDIDDKIIKKSLESNVQNSWRDIAQRFESEFWSDLEMLGVQEPNLKLRVTDNIPEIIEFIEKLLSASNAYIGKDESVYFSVNSYSNYGKLQRLNLEDNEKHESKEKTADFALWKAQKHSDEPAWSTPWGKHGRPGWHIECSALASKLFGNLIDFHAGGLDLKFPHHENEEAQSCCYHKNQQWVNYWIHTGHLNLKGDQEKMSKSLKNTVSISNLLEKYSKDDFRMACIISNYRNSMEFGDEMMLTAQQTLQKFQEFDSDCQAYLDGMKLAEVDASLVLEKLSKVTGAIDEALKDDFNTSKSIGHLSELCTLVSKCINSKSTNYASSSVDVVAAVKNFNSKILQCFGLNQCAVEASTDDVDFKNYADEFLKIRSQIREQAVSSKNKELFKICDEIRDSLKLRGIEIKDHSKGSSWKKK